jgi:hypothetical protein
MNATIRTWIEAQYQPWRSSPDRSVLGGRIGDPGIRPLDPYFADYFRSRGLTLEGHTFEDIKESELLHTFGEVAAWLTCDERDRVDAQIAFGIAFTKRPNACAIRHGDGYAVLFNLALDPVLIATVELWLALSVSPVTVDDEQFATAFNVAIVSIFFRFTTFWSPIPDEGFAHRQAANQLVWAMTAFVLGHEVGHVLLGHLAASGERPGQVTTVEGPAETPIVTPAHRAEFEADQFACQLLMRSTEAADGHGAAAFWARAYVALGLMFAVFESVEELAGRLELETGDTHPRPSERWARIESTIADRVSPATTAMTQRLRQLGTDAARLGPMPSRQAGAAAIFPDQDLVLSWIEADTPSRSRQILKDHPELVSQSADLLFESMDETVSDTNRARVRLLHQVLRRARAIGVDAAYDEWLAAGAPPPSPPAFEVPQEEIAAAGDALRANDLERLARLRREHPRLDRFLDLTSTLNRLLAVRDIGEVKTFIESHLEVLLPTGDLVLNQLTAVQTNPDSVRRLEWLRGLIERSREVGPARAAFECARFWGVPPPVPSDTGL